MAEFPAPAPVADVDSREFWDACRQHRLLVRACEACGRAHYPPGPLCPWCASTRVAWREAAGTGSIHSYVVFNHPFLPELADRLPYAVLRVRLDDWPDAVLYGRLAGAPASEAAMGLPVEVAWEDHEGFALPCWRPRGGGS
jgi:uncharacterized protein